jgi:hypothetical protein
MRKALAALALFSAASAVAATAPRPLPEDEAKGIHGYDGICPLRPYSTVVLSPEVEPDPRGDDSWKREARDEVRRARARLVRVKRDLDRIHQGVDAIVLETNACNDALWDRLSILISTSEAAARDEAEPPLAMFATGGRETWAPRPLAAFAADEASAPPIAPGRYSGACRAPDVDADLYAPSSASLPPGARGKLAGIAGSAAKVSGALLGQKKALDELLTLTAGRQCREILSAFDSLVRTERQAFFDYREKAVAGAVWSELRWERTPPAR